MDGHCGYLVPSWVGLSKNMDNEYKMFAVAREARGVLDGCAISFRKKDWIQEIQKEVLY